MERLPIHLPLEQRVQFDVGHEDECVHRTLTNETKLEARFPLSASAAASDEPRAQNARTIRYPEVQTFFTWDSKAHSGTPERKQRVDGTSPGD